MSVSLVFVGLDVHKDSIVIASARQGNSASTFVDTLPHDFPKLLKRLKRIADPAALRVCYEAGPPGFELARSLKAKGIDCAVIAPSLIPVQQGCHIKTDRRDAARLASLFRAGELTKVAIPEPHVEAMRDLARARDDFKRDERVARQRLDKFLLRQSRFWSGGTKWTQRHMAWVRAQTFEHLPQTRTLATYLTAIDQATGRVDQLTKDLEELVQNWELGPLVTALQALRGVQLVTAVTLVSEVGNFARFPSAHRLMSYVGLVPREHSSGARRRQGGITKTGNKHLRRILVEAAWNYRFRPKVSKSIEARRAKVSPQVRAIAEKAERRLTRRFERLQQKGKQSKQAVTAVARELLGFVWAIAREEKLLAD
jgi:transposase